MTTNFNKYGSPVKQETDKITVPKGDLSKYGKVVSDVSSEEVKTEKDDNIVQSILRPAVTLGIARPIQAVKTILGATPEEASVKVPGFGTIEAPKSAEDVYKDVGRGLQTIALGAAGPISGGAAFGAGTAISEGKDLGTVALYGIGGAIAGKALDVVGKPLLNAAGKVIGKITPQVIQDSVASGAKLVSDTAGNIKIMPKDWSTAINKGAVRAEELANKPFQMAGQAIEKGITEPVKTMFGKPKITETEAQKLLKKKIPDTRVVESKIERGKIVPDVKAKEAIKQGIPDTDVALIKNATPKDKVKMAKMLDIREKSLTNKRVVERSTDVAGDTFMSQTKHIEKVNKDARKTLNTVAQRLKGKTADATDSLVQFSNDMETSGIGVLKNGKLNFKGSDFEGLKSVQTTINNIWNRARRVAKSGDALQLHRMKSYIDEVVNYGKATEGLGGKAERILKGLRHNIDASLDSKFPAYNKVNSVLSDTINQLNGIGESMGKKFRIGDTFSGMHAGTTLRRILSNTQSRADMLRLLGTVQETAKKYGMKIEEDVINQVHFADTLEKMFGSEAPSSFLGQIEKGVGDVGKVASAGAEFMKGNWGKAGVKATKAMYEITQGITNENKMASLRSLLNTEKTKGITVFGKK